MPPEDFPPVAPAVPVTIPALPPLPNKAPPVPAAVKPITPDSPDIRPTHMPSPPMQLSFANISIGQFSRSHTPSCKPQKRALNRGSLPVLSDSHAVHAERQDPGQVPIRQTDKDYKPSGITQAGSHRGQGVLAQGCGLPPIPAAHSAGSPPSPKGRVGKGIASPASKAPGVSSKRAKHSVKPSKDSRPPNIVTTGVRSRPMPGWNDDFSVQHSDPVSIKDQERHMSKTHQGSAKRSQMLLSRHTALQPPGGQSAAAQHGPAKQASNVSSAAGASSTHKLWTQQCYRPPAAHEPCAQCVDTVRMNDDWERSLQSSQIGCSSVRSRNLDSAQSPLRPMKGEHGGCIGFYGQAELDKASFTGVQGAAIKPGQQQDSSGQLLPPLLNALVLDEATSMAAPLTSSAASFLMHASSFSPLRNSQLESLSPSHPSFAHISGQKSHDSIGQNPWADRKALLTDAEVLNAEAGQQQADRSPNAHCSHDSSPVRPVSSNSPIYPALMEGSKQQSVAQIRSQAAFRNAHRADSACSAPAAQQSRAGSSRAHWSKATGDCPEEGNNTVNAQQSPASSFETASRCKAGSKSGSAAVVAAVCNTSIQKPSSSFSSTGCSLFARYPTPHMASKACKPTDCFMLRPGSAVDIEDAKVAAAAREASIAAEAEAASCHSASSLPRLTDYLARQSLSCEGTNQLCCSSPEEILSALNSTDLAFLAAAKPLQQETDLPRLELLQPSTSSTVALDSQQFQTKSGSVSRSSCIHIPAQIDDDDDLVLHDSMSQAAVMSYSQPGVTDTSFGKATCQNGAECAAAAEDTSSVGFTSTVLGKQCWLGNTDTKALWQQDCASSLLNLCASLDSLYADNDWE
ncbi:TPA: hypothetical protein ACH3X2_006736 [Trebouxia sp. C0005]